MKALHAMTVALLTVYLAGCGPRTAESGVGQDLASAPVAPGADRCQALVGVNLGSGTIEKAAEIQRGTHLIGFFRRLIARVMLPGALPDLSVQADFCRVTASLAPVKGSTITVEVWLPDRWNEKLVAVGGGGFNGGLDMAPLTLWSPLAKAYAGVATDVGHEPSDSAKFAHDSRQQFVDYAYQGNHVAVAFAKELITSYYGRTPTRAYFYGCSNGGRDALMAASRFPADFDGIIAGAPAGSWSGLMTSFAWNAQAARRAPGLKKKLKLIQEHVVASCDTIDGVKDEMIENPARCPFDPNVLLCRGDDGADCLIPEEIEALRRIYAGPQLSDGTQIYSGMPVGGEALSGNWDTWIVGKKGMQATMAQETFRWMVFGDANWNIESFDIDRDYPKAKEALAGVMDADDPNLHEFTRRNGRLLLYHGWNDAAIPAGATIEYHNRLRTTLGPDADARIRLFMVPGMMHCAGGIGPTEFETLDTLDSWVETGVAPERIVARQYDPPAIFFPPRDARIIRTRPLCPWPQVASFDGSGSSDDEANFACR